MSRKLPLRNALPQTVHVVFVNDMVIGVYDTVRKARTAMRVYRQRQDVKGYEWRQGGNARVGFNPDRWHTPGGPYARLERVEYEVQ